MDRQSQYDEQYDIRKNTIKHEVGHLLVSKQLSFFPQGITISSDGRAGGNHSNAIRSLLNSNDVANYCLDRAKVLVAGAFAEAVINGANGIEFFSDIANSIFNSSPNAISDRQKFDENINTALNTMLSGINLNDPKSQSYVEEIRSKCIHESLNFVRKFMVDNKIEIFFISEEIFNFLYPDGRLFHTRDSFLSMDEIISICTSIQNIDVRDKVTLLLQ